RHARVRALFASLGYPGTVAWALAALCTTRSDVPGAPRLGARHLPQGAPTSPAIANLVARRLDVRLGALARSVGARYTRYADDLALSGELRPSWIVDRVAEIARDEGFRLRPAKTRVMRRGVRQELAGVVVNEKTSARRVDLDLLEAILVNCVRRGPSTQNR